MTDDLFELSRLALIATTRNAVLYLLARSKERAGKEVDADAEGGRSPKQQNEKNDDGELPQTGIAIQDAGDIFAPQKAEIPADHCMPPP